LSGRRAQPIRRYARRASAGFPSTLVGLAEVYESWGTLPLVRVTTCLLEERDGGEPLGEREPWRDNAPGVQT
jgi:hypothetical protein